MVEEIRSSGEQLERGQRRRRYAIMGGLFAVGLIVGLMAGHYEEGFFESDTAWPPAFAIGVSAAYAAAMIFGSIALSRQSDEVLNDAQYKAVAAAGAAYMLVYPIWFALWKGGLVAEPIHWVLFLIFWFVLTVANLYFRYR